VTFGVSTHQISTTPNAGSPNPKKNSGFWKFISSILFDVEIFAEFTGRPKLFFKLEQSGGDIARKLPVPYDRLELTLVDNTV